MWGGHKIRRLLAAIICVQSLPGMERLDLHVQGSVFVFVEKEVVMARIVRPDVLDAFI